MNSTVVLFAMIALVSVTAIATCLALLSTIDGLRAGLKKCRRECRVLAMAKCMNRASWVVDCWRRSSGSPPKSLADLIGDRTTRFLGMIDPDTGATIPAYAPVGQEEPPRGVLNFRYLPAYDLISERVELTYYDLVLERWYTRIISDTGPHFEWE